MMPTPTDRSGGTFSDFRRPVWSGPQANIRVEVVSGPGMSLAVQPYSANLQTQYGGIDLPRLERQTRDVLTSAANAAKGFVENTVDDIRLIYDASAECLAQIDRVRLRATHRAIEYHTAVTRLLMDIGMLPVALIDDIWRAVAPQLYRQPNPSLWRLRNPRQAVWDDIQPSFEQVLDPDAIPNPDRVPLLFVHGKGLPARPSSAFYNMFYQFEREADIFRVPEVGLDGRTCDVYLLSYDTDMTDEDETIIRGAFEAVIGSPVGPGAAPLMFLAVMWRELERRASVSADYLLPFVKNMFGRSEAMSGGVISQSLGSFLFSRTAQKWSDDLGDINDPILSFWWSMAAAVPANAFTATGLFRDAPAIASAGDGWLNGTAVWYSYYDAVLQGAYSLVNGTAPAMGQTGPLDSRLRDRVKEVNTTGESGESHVIPEGQLFGGYFRRLGNLIRTRLGKPER